MNFHEAYTSPDIFIKEVKNVFSQAWFYCGHDADWLKNQMAKSISTCQGEALICRQETGNWLAFRNACRHLGMKLPCIQSGPRKNLTCPYHGWEFDQLGRLAHLPIPENFPGLNQAKIKLKELNFKNTNGYHFVNFSDTESNSFQKVNDMVSSIPEKVFKPIIQKKFLIRCNWKMIMEQGLEAYHALTAHGDTLARYLDFSRIKSTSSGNHFLNTYPMKVNLLAQLLGVFPKRETVFHRFTIFPFTMISLPIPGNHCSVTTVNPISVNETEVSFYFYFKKEALNPMNWIGARLACWRSLKILEEDLSLLEDRQKAIQMFTEPLTGFGKMEKSVQAFHDNLRIQMAMDT